MEPFATSALVFGYVIKFLCFVVVLGCSYVLYTMITDGGDNDLYSSED